MLEPLIVYVCFLLAVAAVAYAVKRLTDPKWPKRWTVVYPNGKSFVCKDRDDAIRHVGYRVAAEAPCAAFMDASALTIVMTKKWAKADEARPAFVVSALWGSH